MNLTTLIIIIVILLIIVGLIFLLLRLLKVIAIILVIALIIIASVMIVKNVDWGTSLNSVKEATGKVWDDIKHSDIIEEIKDKIKDLIPGGD